MLSKGNIAIVIVAAGSGSRFGADLPKQFCLMNGRPLLMTAIERFNGYLPESPIVVVLSEDMTQFWGDLCLRYDFKIAHRIVKGGETRYHSVKNALLYIDRSDIIDMQSGMIMIHDGARPNISRALIDRAIEQYGVNGSVPIVPVVDSIVKFEGDDFQKAKSVDRKEYAAVQTPQVFDARYIIDAYKNSEYEPTMTDDASVAGTDNVYLGDYRNIKVTNPTDILIAEIYSALIDNEQ